MIRSSIVVPLFYLNDQQIKNAHFSFSSIDQLNFYYEGKKTVKLILRIVTFLIM